MKLLFVFGLVGLVLSRWVDCFEDLNLTEVSHLHSYGVAPNPLMVGLTLIGGAAAKGAVCLDGTSPGYHLHRGFGSGANSWLIQLEGGGWCNDIRTCVYRKKTRRGSSTYMEKQIPFTGILSNKAEENPDFFNWNRVKLRYCDGASFSGDGQHEAAGLNFRGQRIWLAGMEDLMSKGMRHANQALLSGCSAGGLAAILHCDEFQALFPSSTKVKCLSDAGLFLDAIDVSGGHTLRNMFGGVVSLQGVQKNLPGTCTVNMDPTSCFFPQNLISNIKTPLFLLNAAYDAWQLQASLAPPSADPHGDWHECKLNHASCTASQIQFLQGFRNQMLNAIKGFSMSRENGLFINSCFAHCQTERQDTWFADESPLIGSKGIAQSVGDWYFDRVGVKAIDCAYPCDKTCHNLVFEKKKELIIFNASISGFLGLLIICQFSRSNRVLEIRWSEFGDQGQWWRSQQLWLILGFISTATSSRLYNKLKGESMQLAPMPCIAHRHPARGVRGRGISSHSRHPMSRYKGRN